MLTQAHLQELADLAVSCRPHGAPQWHHSGVMAALRKVQHCTLPEVMRAVVVAAEDRTLRTPAPIGDLDGGVWKTVHAPSSSVRARPPDPGRLCSVCSRPQVECRARWAGDHDYVSAEDHRALVSKEDPLERSLQVRDLKRLIGTFGKIPPS